MLGMIVKGKFVVLCLLLLLGASVPMQALDLTPVVSYFSPFACGGGDSNWGISQDREGRIYVANRSGLLEYDGSRWELHTLPIPTKLVRSVYVDPQNGRIYVGAFEEFGYFQRNDRGELVYFSLSRGVEDYTMQNDEIWNIVPLNGRLYFQSFTSFFVYDGESTHAIRNRGDLYLFFFAEGRQLFTYDSYKGLAKLDPKSNQFQKVNFPDLGSRIITVLSLPKSKKRLYITEKSGIFQVDAQGNTARFDRFGANYPWVNKALLSRNGSLIIGTIDHGVYALNESGATEWVLNRESGLENNTILGLYEDIQGNLWAALNKGVAIIHANSPFRSLIFDNRDIGAIYSAQLIGDRYYIGTNFGLFQAPMNDIARATPVAAVKSQVWEIVAFDRQGFVGTNKHTFTIQGGGIRVASMADGGMTIQKAEINGQEILVEGTYSDICIYRKNSQGVWTFSHHLEGFSQPIRHIEVDYEGNIWCAHLHKGLYRLSLNNEATKIVSMRYYPAVSAPAAKEEAVYVNKIGNRVVFSNDSLFYVYNEHDQKMIPYDKLNDQLPSFRGAGRIISLGNNRYWLIKKDAAALVKWEAEIMEPLNVVNLSVLKSFFVDSEQNIIPLSNGKYLFCLDNRFAVYDENYPIRSYKHPELIVTEILLMDKNGKTLHEVLPQQGNRVEVKASTTSLTIRCAYPDYINRQAVTIGYKLYRNRRLQSEGVLRQGELSLTALPEGKYSLDLFVLDDEGQLTSSVTLEIRKFPYPWASALAFIVYLLLGGVVGMVIYQSKKRRLIARFESKQKEQFVRLENEKLSSELEFKGKELASYALQQLRHNDALTKIKKEVLEQKLAMGSQYPNKYSQKLLSLIEEHLSSQDDWKVFEQNFDLIHEHFFRTLRNSYPELTANDLRLCGYLRLNLSSKEIADLMSISPKGVEVARYRLRKKLHLSDNQSLVDFMIGIGEA